MRKWNVLLAVWFIINLSQSLFGKNLMLGYHMVDYSYNHFYSVLPDVLEWQIDYLKSQGVPVVSMEEWARQYQSKTNLSAEISFDDGWKSQMNAVPILSKAGVKGLFFIFPDPIGNNRHYLTTNDLLALKNSGVAEFGSHSYTHPELVRQSDASLQREVVESKKVLEGMLGQEIKYFAYPYGVFDENTKKLVSENYQFAVGVKNALNDSSSDPYNLSRHLIFKTTTFGEFIRIVDELTGKKVGYTVTNLGRSGAFRHFGHVSVYLFEIPGKGMGDVLILPNSSIGAGWMHKTISSLTSAGYGVHVMVGRNNHLPFDRPEKELHTITNWGITQMVKDVDSVLDYLKSEKKQVSVITWGDGFDTLMAGLSYRDFGKTVKGVVAINPSVRASEKGEFTENIKKYEAMLRDGQYSPENVTFFQKVKVLCDMMFLKPDDPSPFTNFSYKGLSNKDLLERFVDDSGDPDLSITYRESGYTMDDFRESLVQPYPVFTPLVSLTFLRDLNLLWEKDFNWQEKGITGKDGLKFPVVLSLSSQHENCLGRITNTFKGLSVQQTYYKKDMSTVEQMLDTETGSEILREISRFK